MRLQTGATMKIFFPMLFILGGCGWQKQEFECCQNGIIEICSCRDQCMRQRFMDNGDGTCSVHEPTDTDTADTAQ